MTAVDERRAIVVGDRVSLLVNDLGGYVSGVVADVYVNAAGIEVADVELYGSRIFVQNTQFLTLSGVSR